MRRSSQSELVISLFFCWLDSHQGLAMSESSPFKFKSGWTTTGAWIGHASSTAIQHTSQLSWATFASLVKPALFACPFSKHWKTKAFLQWTFSFAIHHWLLAFFICFLLFKELHTLCHTIQSFFRVNIAAKEFDCSLVVQPLKAYLPFTQELFQGKGVIFGLLDIQNLPKYSHMMTYFSWIWIMSDYLCMAKKSMKFDQI